jgi:hypothetical protein
MWICWLIGHRFKYIWALTSEPTNFCTRCGKQLPESAKITD